MMIMGGDDGDNGGAFLVTDLRTCKRGFDM